MSVMVDWFDDNDGLCCCNTKNRVKEKENLEFVLTFYD